MANTDPIGFDKLTTFEQEVVKKLAGDAASWDQLGRNAKGTLLAQAVSTGLLPDRIAQFEKAKRSVAKVLVVMVALLIFGVIKLWPTTTPEELAAKALKEVVATCHNQGLAAIFAQDFVTQKLKSPSTAQFPSATKSDVHAFKNCTYEVRGYFDAQNSFGAMLRGHYNVTLQYDMDRKVWKTLQLQID